MDVADEGHGVQFGRMRELQTKEDCKTYTHQDEKPPDGAQNCLYGELNA
jgi:hypothetical protein